MNKNTALTIALHATYLMNKYKEKADKAKANLDFSDTNVLGSDIGTVTFRQNTKTTIDKNALLEILKDKSPEEILELVKSFDNKALEKALSKDQWAKIATQSKTDTISVSINKEAIPTLDTHYGFEEDDYGVAV